MGCTVHLQGPLSSLQIRDLTACTVVGGPVTGPTFVHGKHLLYSLHLTVQMAAIMLLAAPCFAQLQEIDKLQQCVICILIHRVRN